MLCDLVFLGGCVTRWFLTGGVCPQADRAVVGEGEGGGQQWGALRRHREPQVFLTHICLPVIQAHTCLPVLLSSVTLQLLDWGSSGKLPPVIIGAEP